jgi:hypothetical protein
LHIIVCGSSPKCYEITDLPLLNVEPHCKKRTNDKFLNVTQRQLKSKQW